MNDEEGEELWQLSIGGACASGDGAGGANIRPIQAEQTAWAAITVVTLQQYCNKGLLDEFEFVAAHKQSHSAHVKLLEAHLLHLAH